MLSARFDYVVSLANRDEDRTDFVRCPLTQAPNVGETINLHGDPFVIIERIWAIDPDTHEQWVHLRCLPAASPAPYAKP